jgi:hypothetical protein
MARLISVKQYHGSIRGRVLGKRRLHRRMRDPRLRMVLFLGLTAQITLVSPGSLLRRLEIRRRWRLQLPKLQSQTEVWMPLQSLLEGDDLVTSFYCRIIETGQLVNGPTCQPANTSLWDVAFCILAALLRSPALLILLKTSQETPSATRASARRRIRRGSWRNRPISAILQESPRETKRPAHLLPLGSLAQSTRAFVLRHPPQHCRKVSLPPAHPSPATAPRSPARYPLAKVFERRSETVSPPG